jgi:hypothetical protein
MPVLEIDGALVAGPERWPGSLAMLAGLRGNALPPLPYETAAGTLRQEHWAPAAPPPGMTNVRGDWADGEVDGEGRWVAPTRVVGPGPDIHAADAEGRYLGVFHDTLDAETGDAVADGLPAGARAVPEAPPGPGHIWDGNAWVEDPDYVPPVPATVTALAGKFVLMDMGLLDTVEAMIAAHEYRGMRLFWTATVWDRANPYLTGMALELDLTDEQVDDMFRAAEVRT